MARTLGEERKKKKKKKSSRGGGGGGGREGGKGEKENCVVSISVVKLRMLVLKRPTFVLLVLLRKVYLAKSKPLVYVRTSILYKHQYKVAFVRLTSNRWLWTEDWRKEDGRMSFCNQRDS